VKLLNDKFGIQVRGGCSCAGTYGHYLLNVNQETSNSITCSINEGDLTNKPGWIRMSIHPTTTSEEIQLVCDAIIDLAENFTTWQEDYVYNPAKNDFNHKNDMRPEVEMVKSWFN
jgi:selenocysteine lyase/cysteine desulfurase